MYEELRADRDRILENIGKLKDFLTVNKPSVAAITTVSQIPRYDPETQQQDKLPEVDGAGGSMDFCITHNAAATPEQIATVLSDFGSNDPDILTDGSAKVTFKYPGVVIVPCDPLQLRHLIHDINTSKERFSATLKRLGRGTNPFDHFEQVHKRLPGLVVLQATRNVFYSEQRLRKVTFCWRYNGNSQKTDRETLLTMLARRLDYLATRDVNASSDAQRLAVEAAIETIQGLTLEKGEGLRLRRTNANPVPSVHIYRDISDPDNKDLRRYISTKASLPIFGTDDRPDEAKSFEVGFLPELQSFNEAEKPPSRTRTRYITTVLSPELGIVKVRDNNYSRQGN